jgi:hypothetical protein
VLRNLTEEGVKEGGWGKKVDVESKLILEQLACHTLGHSAFYATSKSGAEAIA